jgi:hypothetical protein
MIEEGSDGGDGMQLKFLFWLAVILAVLGMHSPDGNLFYFFAAHLTTLMIGVFLHRREKRGSAAPAARHTTPKSSAPAVKRKTV